MEPRALPPGSSPDFDFDEWMLLARQDPAAYFRRREQVIQNFINAHPAQSANLRAMQARIDAARAIAGTPDKALRTIMQMLEDRVGALGDQMQLLHGELTKLQAAVPADRLAN